MWMSIPTGLWAVFANFHGLPRRRSLPSTGPPCPIVLKNGHGKLPCINRFQIKIEYVNMNIQDPSLYRAFPWISACNLCLKPFFWWHADAFQPLTAGLVGQSSTQPKRDRGGSATTGGAEGWRMERMERVALGAQVCQGLDPLRLQWMRYDVMTFPRPSRVKHTVYHQYCLHFSPWVYWWARWADLAISRWKSRGCECSKPPRCFPGCWPQQCQTKLDMWGWSSQTSKKIKEEQCHLKHQRKDTLKLLAGLQSGEHVAPVAAVMSWGELDLKETSKVSHKSCSPGSGSAIAEEHWGSEGCRSGVHVLNLPHFDQEAPVKCDQNPRCRPRRDSPEPSLQQCQFFSEGFAFGEIEKGLQSSDEPH